MASVLPGQTSPNAGLAVTKAALRVFGFGGVVDAISELSGLRTTKIESMVDIVTQQLADQPLSEFTDLSPTDRSWAEKLLADTYVRLAQGPNRAIMGESLIGANAVAQLAMTAMQEHDRRDIDAAPDGIRTYLDVVSGMIAVLISDWYSTDEAANRSAMSHGMGELVQSMRSVVELVPALRAYLEQHQNEQREAKALAVPEPEPARVLFELDWNNEPLATDAVLTALVEAAVVAVIDNRPLRVEVTLPTLDIDLSHFSNTVQRAQLRRDRLAHAERLRGRLSAFFSSQVESAWGFSFPLTAELSERMTVFRALLRKQEATGTKLDVWRTEPPTLSAPIWLTPTETAAVLRSVGLARLDYLRAGPYWRAADELPKPLILEKVMPSILSALARHDAAGVGDWPAGVLTLAEWHIGQG